MPSNSEKQAALFYKITRGEPVDQKKYGHITPAHAAKMHAEDREAGRFFDSAGKALFDLANPRSKSEMESG